MKKYLFAAILVLALFPSVPVFAEQPPGELWSMSYNRGPTDDYSNAVAVDGSGNVFVAGRTFNALNDDVTVIKYDAAGNTVWLRNYDTGTNEAINGIATDASGNIYCAGYSGLVTKNFLVIKYDSGGNTQWVRTYKKGAAENYAQGIAVDASGNIFVAGVSNDGFFEGMLVVKYSSDGDTMQDFLESGTINKRARGVALFPDGSIVVTGSYGNADRDIYTVKFEAAGNTAWTRRYSISTEDEGNAVAVDGSGNVYVAGFVGSGGLGYDYITIKYTSAGDTVWVRRYNGGNGDKATGIAVDGNGYVYVSGNSSNGIDDDFLVIKYGPDGDTAWKKAYDSGDDDRSPAVAVDKNGYMYVTGSSHVNTSPQCFTTLKYIQYPTPGIRPPEGTSEVKIGSTGGKGIVYKGDQAIISFKPSAAGSVTVKIYTLTGMLVKEFAPVTVTNPSDSSKNNVLWDCLNANGGDVVSGAYIVYVDGPGLKVSKKVIIVR